MKIFISLPMHHRSNLCIASKIDDAKDQIQKMFGADEEIEFIDNFHKVIPEGLTNERIWCLGDSIKLMQDADYVVFTNDYLKARGCRVEFEVCKEYHIPCIILGGELTEAIKSHPGISGFHKMVLNDGFLGKVDTDD